MGINDCHFYSIWLLSHPGQPQVLKRQREEEKEEQTTHAATQREHFKNQEIFNSNQIRKNIERHDKNGDNNSNSVFFCLFVCLFLKKTKKKISKLKNTKSKKQLLHRAVDNKKHILGVRLLLCVQFIFV